LSRFERINGAKKAITKEEKCCMTKIIRVVAVLAALIVTISTSTNAWQLCKRPQNCGESCNRAYNSCSQSLGCGGVEEWDGEVIKFGCEICIAQWDACMDMECPLMCYEVQ
jgi:hypothetical protein